MEQTPIYHFNKPARSEKVNVDLLNQNMDIVENNLKNISDNLEKAIDETTEAGTDLDNKLSDEIARATNKENELSNALNNEIQRATDNEATLSDALNSEVTRATDSEAELDDKITEETNRAKTAESSLKSTIDTNKPNWDDKYTKNEIDNKFSTLETNIDWKEAVDTYTDITVKYPNPQDGWTVNVKDTDYTYRFSGTSWVPISANSIPKATNDVDGLLSKEGYAKYEDANNKKHTHSNKSVLDGITSALVEAWNNAVTALKTVVTGIKGDSETAYRHGDVNITKANIGLGNVPNVTTNNQTPTFTQASARENIASGNTLSVIMGKIMKYFADLKTVAFTGSYNDLSGKPTIPTTLPANGGNADTVDSKHASDLVLKAGDTMTGALTVPNLTDSGLTASRVVTSDASKKLVSSAVTATELGYLSGVTSSIQTQLNNKVAAGSGTAQYAKYFTETLIAASTDLNTIVQPGFYYCETNAKAQGLTNAASGNAFFMIVGCMNPTASVTQIVFEYMTTGQKIFFRNKYQSTWGAWQRIYNTQNKPALTADVTGVLSVANGGTGNANGTIAKLTTARKLKVNLASTSDVTFDGSADQTGIGVTGTLPIGNGGTGATTGFGKGMQNLGRLTAFAASNAASAPSANFLNANAGVHFSETYGSVTNSPCSYGHVLSMLTSAATQLVLEWPGSNTGNGNMFFRSHRDNTSAQWSPWNKVITDQNYKTIVTPANIGAAATKHTHTKSEITDFPSIPTTLKNPYALTIKTNGTSKGVYDGSAAKEVNITCSDIGAATTTKVTEIEKSLKTVVYQSAEPTSGLVDNLVWIG